MNAKDILRQLRQNELNLYAIHYSCETLGDGNEGLSPRITSIAVLHMPSSNMHSFSIHLVAEVSKVTRESISDHYDSLEKQMLIDFYEFVKSHQDTLWLHWNMSNINYGFEALAHRYRVLCGNEAQQILDSKRFNLSSMIADIYGSNCVDQPRMFNLMKANGGQHRDF